MMDFWINFAKVHYPITKVSQSKLNHQELTNIRFGKIFTDYMFVCEYESGEWSNERIIPFGDISISPGSLALHYGQTIFEGMKAFKDKNDKTVLFRAMDNIRRFNQSADRMCMPQVPEYLFNNALKQLAKLEENWIPNEENSALYIRPIMFADESVLGVRPSNKYKFIIMCCAVNAYYNNPLSVIVAEKYSRAVSGGVGFAKCGGNYGATLKPNQEAIEQGYDQILWTDASEHKYLEETGTTNIFVQINDTVITPNLHDTILAGITRDSLIQLLKDKNVTVEERPISIDELLAAHKNGSLKEMFVSGTAAVVINIKNFAYKGIDYPLNINETPMANYLFKTLDAIRKRKIDNPYNWVEDVENISLQQ